MGLKRTVLMVSILFCLAGITRTMAQQTLDSSDVRYYDNTSDNNIGTTGTLMNDPTYREFPPTIIVPGENDGFYTNNSTVLYWGGNHRRAGRTGSGNNSGAHVHFYCTVQQADYYLAYHHMNSGNASSNAYVKFFKPGISGAVDSMRYNELQNNTADLPSSFGSWLPLGIVALDAVDSALTVEIGLDSLSSNVLRVDAIALVRSHRQGPDIEFGSRRFSRNLISGTDTVKHDFYKHRAPLGFPETSFRWNMSSDVQLPVYNLGTENLIITGYNTQTTRFSISSILPLVVPPGRKGMITVRFSPRGEETSRDTILLLSNDPLEPAAKLPVIGTGVNYNFILNASLTNEPHWNVPGQSGEFSYTGTFASSTASPWPYPIPNGNAKSIVNTSADPSISVLYKFTIPDSLAGRYFLEYSGPAGSSNAAQNVKVDVVTPGYVNPVPALADTQRVTGVNTRLVTTNNLWVRIGGNNIFTINAGQTKIRFMNPQQGTDYLRADLLRVRMAPIAPTIATNVDPNRKLLYGVVSIVDSIRQLQQNFRKTVVIKSVGEQPLTISGISIKRGNVFHITNTLTFPINLPSVDGKYVLGIDFLPSAAETYTDSLIIYSNDPALPIMVISIAGTGVAGFSGFIQNISATETGSSPHIVRFGLLDGATDDEDPQFGENALPAIPANDIMFKLPIDATAYSYADFRALNSGSRIWRLGTQFTSAATLTWNPALFPAGEFTLQDTAGGAQLSVNMKQVNSVTILPSMRLMDIKMQVNDCVNGTVNQGWNLIGVPVIPANRPVNAVFPTANSQCYQFNNGYTVVDSLTFGKGYWLRFPVSALVSVCGEPSTANGLPVAAGWNMITPGKYPVAVQNITSVPAGIISSPFYGYAAQYSPADTLKPLRGYWIRASQAGSINFTTGENAEAKLPIRQVAKTQWNRITVTNAKQQSTSLYLAQESVTDAFILPPAPPAGAFDVRFSTDKSAETVNGKPLRVKIQTTDYPVTIILDKAAMQVKDAASGTIINTRLAAGKQLVISNPQVQELDIVPELIPTQFALEQNYPNPFNPATTIRFAIPEKSVVSLIIYNQLGQKVQELINGEYEAGYYSQEWNATPFASGVYFYELRTKNFSAIKKLMLVK